MKIVLIGLCLLPILTLAQWQPNGATTGNIYYNNGDVGIGTSSPPHTLSLYRNENANLGIVTNQSTSEASLWFRINSTVRDAGIIYRSDGRLSFNLDNGDGAFVQDNEYMTILNNGKIGMGTINPYQESRLHIKSPSAQVWGFVTEAATNKKIVALGHNGIAGFLSVSYLDGSGFSPLNLNTSNQTRMSIAIDGNVGIGTDSPSKLLQLHGSNNPTLAIGKLNTNTTGKSSLIFYAGDGSVANAFTLQYRREPNIDRLGFVGGGGVEHLSFLNSGNVGIGTTNPGSYQLAVEGKIGAREVVVTTAAWADYVFENTYNLRPLSEVESYIKENKHLPEIPSAKDVEVNGVNLGEMNMLLLKKVEELTLYLLEQNKTNQEQAKEIESLQQQLQILKK